jgi:hypothetical protein
MQSGIEGLEVGGVGRQLAEGFMMDGGPPEWDESRRLQHSTQEIDLATDRDLLLAPVSYERKPWLNAKTAILSSCKEISRKHNLDW